MSRVIVKCLMNELSQAEACTCATPTSCSTGCELIRAEQPLAAHFIDGNGPHPGLLRHDGDGTIPGSHSNSND
jgi:hypothetical protein